VLDLIGKATGMFEVPDDVVPGVVRNPTTSDETNRNDL